MLPVRWVASDSGHIDPQNRLWLPDQFFQNGRRRADSAGVTNSSDPELYQSERYGNFSYAIPVADSTYRLTLYFSEHWFGTQHAGGSPIGQRVFDVFCNGNVLLRNFDIAREAGGSMLAMNRTFRGLKANHQGKLLLSFEPVTDYANVDAVEVVDEKTGEYFIDHSGVIYLIGRDGQYLGFMPPQTAPDRLIEILRKHLTP